MTPVVETPVTPEAPAEVHDIPDWLKGTESTESAEITTPEVPSTTSTVPSTVSPLETPGKTEEPLSNEEKIVDTVGKKIPEEQPTTQTKKKATQET